MLSPDLKAQAQMAWNNWKAQLSGKFPPISEEEYINLVATLQGQHFSGQMPAAEYDRQLIEILRNPSGALQVLRFEPPQRSTDTLLRELESLHRSKVLNDEEYEERKSELMFQRNVKPEDGTPLNGLPPEARRQRLIAHLDALLQERVITQIEYDSLSARI